MKYCGICECSEEVACVGGCAWLSCAEINRWLVPVAGQPVNICTRCRTIFEIVAMVLSTIVGFGNRGAAAFGHRVPAGSFLGLTQQIRRRYVNFSQRLPRE